MHIDLRLFLRFFAFLTITVLSANAAWAVDLDVTTNQSLAAGSYTYGNVWVRSGATLTLEGDAVGETGVTITATNITVEAGAIISADEQGYEAEEGPGAPTSTSSGAGHGGMGGQGNSGAPGLPYGSATAPFTLGSGGSEGPGGGAIRLNVAGTMAVEGIITANGAYGGSAGGSIYIVTGTFSGAGTIRANGGRGQCPSCSAYVAGGGGGRVAVYYSTSVFSGTVEARGGTGNHGEQPAASQHGTVGLFDVSNPAEVHLYTGHAWRFQAGDVEYYETVTAVDCELTIEDGVELVVADTFAILRTAEPAVSTLGIFEDSGTLALTAGTFILGEGCTIDANEKGYPEYSGPGAPDNGGCGASHGGKGGQSSEGTPGQPYGSAVAPTTLGSGASDGPGGGAVRLEVLNALTVDGVITANGAYGGSAGGSIYITTDAFGGGGTIRANGGRGQCPSCTAFIAGGGGGRVAIHHTSSTFTGTIEARGGLGNHGEQPERRQNGTVGLFDVSNPDQVHLYTGHSWWFQADDLDSGMAYHHVTSVDSSIIIEEAANPVSITGDWTIITATPESPTVVELYEDTGAVHLCATNMDFGEGCLINSTAFGHPANTGPGVRDELAGASHGGLGGDGSYGAIPGPTYGSRTAPAALGSGGTHSGGKGGGVVRMEIANVLTLDGEIVAHGVPGSSGGASGGSVYITANSLAGTGYVGANGARGGCPSCYRTAGGGGGGRVAARFSDFAFTGTMECLGGLDNHGTPSGEAGTVMWMREIPINVGGSSIIEHEPFIHYTYRLDWPGSSPNVVLVRLTPLDAEGEWTLLGSFGIPPAPNTADWVGQGPTLRPTPAYEILAPLSAPGTYYFDVFNEVITKNPPRFRLEVIDVTRYLSRTSLGSGSVSGTTTSTITAAGVDDTVTVELRTTGGTVLRTFSPIGWDDTSLTVVFNLGGLTPQAVDVAVVWGDGYEAVIENGFEITGPNPGRIELSGEAPDLARALRTYTAWIKVRNVGGSDVKAPVIRVTSEQELAMRAAPEDPLKRMPLMFVAARDTLPATTLPPGEEVLIPFEVMPEGSPHDGLNFELAVVEEGDTPIDWDTLKPEMQPSSIGNDAWDSIWEHFTDEAGPTWGTFANRLRALAAYLADLDITQRDAARLLELELQVAAASVGIKEPQEVEIDAISKVPGMPLCFARQFANTIDGRHRIAAFGRGWTHSYEYSLAFPETGYAEVTVPGNLVRRFWLSPRGVWQSERGDFGVFEQAGGGYRLSDEGRYLMQFDSGGALTSITDSNGVGVTLAYSSGRLTSITHTNGDAITLAYNVSGYISTMTDHAGRVTTYGYSGGQLASVDPPGAAPRMYSYVTTAGPSHYALQAVMLPDGTQRIFTYDTQGRLLTAARNGGAELKAYAYPDIGAIQTTDGLGNATLFSFDGDDLPLKRLDPLGALVRYAYSGHNLLERILAPDSTLSGVVYDSMGNPMTLYDELNHQAHTEYMPFKRLLQRLEDANGRVSAYSYDSLGNMTEMVYPDATSRIFTVDDDGAVEQIVNRRGDAVNITRNARGAVTQRELLGQRVVDITYDSDFRPVQFTEGGADIDVAYNARDWVTQVDYPNGRTLTYFYNDAGARTLFTSNDGMAVFYTYDAAGRLSRIADVADATIIEYAYDAAGRVAAETRGNGTSSTYSYDPLGRVIGIVHYAPDLSVLDQLTYVYDTMGRCVSVQDLAGLTEYEYDATGRLVGVVYSDASTESYTYDALGNRLTATFGGTSYVYAINELNQYSSVNGTPYGYDDDGNLTSTGTSAFTYDIENRLLQASTGPNTWNYLYDALNNRESVEKGGVFARYLNDPTGAVTAVGEYNTADALVARSVYGLGLVARITAGGDVYYYGFDRAGNTRLVTNPAGQPENTYKFSPFGLVRQSSEGIANPFRYRGAEGAVTDENGLVYMRSRYYDPSLGRFLSPDTIDIRGGLNLYTYVNNDPVNFTDPEGMLFSETGSGSLYHEAVMFNQAMAEEGADGENNSTTNTPPNPPPPPAPTSHSPTPPPPPPPPGGPPSPFVGGPPIEVSPDVYDILTPETRYFLNIEVVAPGDPNEKATSGEGGDNVIVPGERIHYTVYFENVPTASAPAQEVFVTDQLDPNLDLSTLELTEIVWGEETISVEPGKSTLSTRKTVADYRSDVDKLWWVDVDVTLDAGGELMWTFQTLDPATNDLPADVLAGFLPPNDDSGRGEGHVSFTILPKETVPLGTVFSNQATIVFDVEAAISTNVVSNRLGIRCHAADVDLSNAVNAIDIQMVINAALGIETSFNCDIDEQNGVNAVDVQLVVNAALGL